MLAGFKDKLCSKWLELLHQYPNNEGAMRT